MACETKADSCGERARLYKGTIVAVGSNIE